MERRLIDVDKLKQEVTPWLDGSVLVMAFSTLNDAPTVDAEEVVRCAKCEYYVWEVEPCHGRTERGCRHPKGLRGVCKDSFCSYGKRKNERIALEDIVDLDAINKANSASMRRVMDFVGGERRGDE